MVEPKAENAASVNEQALPSMTITFNPQTQAFYHMVTGEIPWPLLMQYLEIMKLNQNLQVIQMNAMAQAQQAAKKVEIAQQVPPKKTLFTPGRYP